MPPRPSLRASRSSPASCMPPRDFELITGHFLRGVKIRESIATLKTLRALHKGPRIRRGSPASVFDLHPSSTLFEMDLFIDKMKQVTNASSPELWRHVCVTYPTGHVPPGFVAYVRPSKSCLTSSKRWNTRWLHRPRKGPFYHAKAKHLSPLTAVTVPIITTPPRAEREVTVLD